MNTIKARAQVQITVEITLNQPWPGDCPINQVHKEASETAMNYIDRLISDYRSHIRHVGRAKVIGILTEEQD